jgi:uncharacterized protein (TIGR02271 family)
MAYTRNSVVGVFENHAQAQRAVDDLRRAGFREDQIGVATQDRSRTATDETPAEGGNAGTGAVTGALAGAGLGAAWGIGIVAGLLPAIGPVIAGGTLAAILASAGLGAAAAGVAGLLIGMGIPEEEANYYESEFQAGRTIVTVKAENRYDEAATIIRRHGGHAQERTGDFQRATFGNIGSTATVRTHEAAGAGQKVQLREEELHVHKQPVQTGEVRVGKEVVTEHKTIQVPVQREEVVIERHPASGKVSSGDLRAGEEIRIPVKEEEVKVDKVTVAKEDVTVGKRTVQGTETVSGDVRKEQVKIEEEGNVNVKNKKKDNK